MPDKWSLLWISLEHVSSYSLHLSSVQTSSCALQHSSIQTSSCAFHLSSVHTSSCALQHSSIQTSSCALHLSSVQTSSHALHHSSIQTSSCAFQLFSSSWSDQLTCPLLSSAKSSSHALNLSLAQTSSCPSVQTMCPSPFLRSDQLMLNLDSENCAKIINNSVDYCLQPLVFGCRHLVKFWEQQLHLYSCGYKIWSMGLWG